MANRSNKTGSGRQMGNESQDDSRRSQGDICPTPSDQSSTISSPSEDYDEEEEEE
jgi:hypothetical protein